MPVKKTSATQTAAIKELRQIKAIASKILKNLEESRCHPPHFTTNAYENDMFAPSTPNNVAKNVTRLTTQAIEHIEHGHIGVAKELLRLLVQQEGE